MKMDTLLVEESCIGLDSLSRSTLKLFVRDVLCLEYVALNDKDSAMFSFKSHVVNRVEIMGIIVRVDKRDNRHFYAVDDGTGVIECKYWKNSNYDTIHDFLPSGLPESLQQKVAQLQDALKLKNEEGFNIGDLFLVRGCVKIYMGRLEIDVLDHRKIENPCLEYQRVLHLRSLYKIYNQPPRLPDCIEKAVKISRQKIFNEESVQIAIIREIQSYITTHTANSVFTETDVLTWSSVAELVQKDEEKMKAKISGSGVDFQAQRMAIIKSALTRLEKNRGFIFQQKEACPSSTGDTYEIITAHCPLSRHVLSVMRKACKHSQRYNETGCHTDDLLDLLKKAHNQRGENQPVRTYSHVTKQVLSHVLFSLESNSDIINVSSQCYLPID